MNKNIMMTTILLVATMSLVMAADFRINSGGASIFTVAANATTIAQNVTLSGWITVAGNITTSENFVGSGKYLTEITIDENSSKLDYHNITSIPTCTGTFLTFDGTDLSCAAISHGAVTIDAANITSGTIAKSILPDLANETLLTYRNITDIPSCATGEHLTFDGTDLSCAAIADDTVLIAGENITSGTIAEARLPNLYNISLISYQNITNIPSCSGTERLTFEGTKLTCNATDGADFANVSYLNNSQTWIADQLFNKSINVTKSLTLMNNDSVITRAGVLTNITIDSSGNININLG